MTALRIHGVGDEPVRITLLARSEWTAHGVRHEAHELAVALRAALSATAFSALAEEIRERHAADEASDE